MMMHGVNLKRRFFVSLVLAVPILLLSSPMGLALPITLSFPGSDWLVAALATVLFVYGGWPFLRGAADEVRNRKPAMMTLSPSRNFPLLLPLSTANSAASSSLPFVFESNISPVFAVIFFPISSRYLSRGWPDR